jgi:hypothetical protein
MITVRSLDYRSLLSTNNFRKSCYGNHAKTPNTVIGKPRSLVQTGTKETKPIEVDISAVRPVTRIREEYSSFLARISCIQI